MGTSRAKTADRRQQIVSAALELLAESRIEAVTTRAIAQRLGISQPALFRHFRSRDAMLAAVLEQVRADLGGLAEQVLAAPGAIESLERLARGLLAHVERHPGLPRLLFGALSGDGGGLQAELRRLLDMQLRLVTALVREGRATGAIAPDLDPEAAAAGLVGMIQGFILQWEAAGRAYPLAPKADVLLSLWRRGVEGGGEAAPPPPPPPPQGRRGLVALDVRPILASGRDPLEDILSALEAVEAPGALELTVPFLPRPLLALLARQGYAPTPRTFADLHLVEVQVGSEVLDLTALEAPEPMVRVLEAAERLGSGEAFVARTPRLPSPLLAELEHRKLAFETLESEDGTALVRVRRPA